MIRRGARGSADDFVVRETTEEVRQPLTLQSPPFVAHRGLGCRMTDNRRSPLNGMNFCHQSHVDKPGPVEQVVVGPGWKLSLEAIANRIVFQGEQYGHHSQANPPAGLLCHLGQ